MSRKGKTDYSMLLVISHKLEHYAKKNVFEIVRCSAYQWNIYSFDKSIILAIYPGSGILYGPRISYDNTGIIDQSGTKYQFSDWNELEQILNKILFAQDTL